MTVTARFFAVLRERMGQAATQVQMAPGATVATLWETIVAERPELRDLRAATRFAVNGQYATPETRLHDGDEVAFLPPMSGGGV
jgi:molybdopterin converting factor subunit 1